MIYLSLLDAKQQPWCAMLCWHSQTQLRTVYNPEQPQRKGEAAAMASKESTNLQELEETVSRLSGHKGVEAVLMLNREGNILVVSGGVNKDDPAATAKQAKFIKQLMDVSVKLILCLDPNDTISFVQLRSKQHQVMLAPHNDYILAVLQDPLVSSAPVM